MADFTPANEPHHQSATPRKRASAGFSAACLGNPKRACISGLSWTFAATARAMALRNFGQGRAVARGLISVSKRLATKPFGPDTTVWGRAAFLSVGSKGEYRECR
ncbi:MAG TPA: hypothetical protein VL918_00585 [Sphingobium sp.]|nr:hypothetical protein [Sphingobium sp.]